jgi:hypothetical protein
MKTTSTSKIISFLLFCSIFVSAQYIPLKKFDFTTKSIFTKKSRAGKMNESSKIDPLKEEKLLKYLLKDYNSNIMPKLNLHDHLRVFFGLALVQLINIVTYICLNFHLNILNFTKYVFN